MLSARSKQGRVWWMAMIWYSVGEWVDTAPLTATPGNGGLGELA
jgi:hypothetical protein